MTAHLLRGGDDFTLGGAFEPVSSTSRLVVDLCGITIYGDSAAEVLDSFTSPTGLEGYRGAIGYRFQKLTGTTWDNISGAESEWEFGAPSIRAINIVEHPQKADAWQIDINETTMGRRLSDSVPVGNPNISANMVTRPRNVNAWRTEDPSNPLLYPTAAITGCTANLGWVGDDYMGCTLDEIDIKGHAVDFWTKPTSVAIEQTYITIEQIVRFPHKDWDGFRLNSHHSNLLYAASLWVNRRNVEDIWDFYVGELKCADISFQPLHNEFRRCVMTFVRDEWEHMEQIPYAPDGKVIQDVKHCADDGDMAYVNADYVTWKQNYLQGFSVTSSPTDFFPYDLWAASWTQVAGATLPATFTPWSC